MKFAMAFLLPVAVSLGSVSLLVVENDHSSNCSEIYMPECYLIRLIASTNRQSRSVPNLITVCYMTTPSISEKLRQYTQKSL